jgi:ligand-binding sensor domain-containing protein/signal transduction histidine kinase
MKIRKSLQSDPDSRQASWPTCYFAGAVLVLLLLLLLPFPVYADNAASAQYTRRLWRVQDGLPEDTVQALAQTPDGFLWVGTTGGLARFDGSRFTIFGENTTPGFQANSIFCILPAGDGSLWLGSEGSGLLHYTHGSVQTYGAAQGLTDGFVRSVLLDDTGMLWIGTDNGLFQLDTRHLDRPRIRRVDARSAMRPIAVHSITEDREHRIWVGGSRLVAIRNGRVQDVQLPGLYSQNRVKTILQTADGTIWVGTVGGLDRLAGAKFVPLPGITGTVRILRQTEDGTLWIGTIGHGLWTYRSGKLAHVSTPGLLPSKTILSIYEDRSRQVWVGTQDGLVRLSRTPVRVLPLPGNSDADFGTISPDGPGKVWVVSSGLFRVTDGAARRYALPMLGSTPVRNVLRDREGGLWIGTDGSGAFHLTAHGITHYSAPQQLTNNFVRAFLEGPQGDMWIGTDQGLNHVTASGVRKYSVKDGLAYFSTRCLLQDHRGDLWIGTDQGISHWSGGRFVHDALTEALRTRRVWSLVEDAEGFLWIGTRDSGLFRFRNGHLAYFTTAQGLASNSTYGMVDDGRGRLWFSGPNTLSSAPLAQMDSSDPVSGLHLDVTTYEMPFGAEDAQFYGGRQPSGFVDAQGRIWFASSDGAVMIPQGHAGVHEQPAPPLFLREITADGRALHVNGGEIQVPASTSRLEFSYAPLMLRPQNAIRFRYRLEGYEDRWNYAGESRTASYTNLPAGHYRFEVLAFSANDPSLTSEAFVSFQKEPHVYQTWWFAVLCVLLLAGTAWFIYRSRIRGIRLRFEAVLAERNRLAREIHDTVIQGCTSISALLEAIASRGIEHAESPEKELLGYARAQAIATIDEARGAVWNLRHGEEQQHDLLSLLHALAENAGQEFGVSVACHREGRSFSVNGWVAHELLMAVREAVYNAVLHGAPQHITVSTEFQAGEIRISIADDGKGFDPAAVLAKPGAHYGILGMRERIQGLGGELKVLSAPGKGTTVKIVVKPARHRAVGYAAETSL